MHDTCGEGAEGAGTVGAGTQILEALVDGLGLSCAVRSATLEVLRRELLTAEQLMTCVTDEVSRPCPAHTHHHHHASLLNQSIKTAHACLFILLACSPTPPTPPSLPPPPWATARQTTSISTRPLSALLVVNALDVTQELDHAGVLPEARLAIRALRRMVLCMVG